MSAGTGVKLSMGCEELYRLTSAVRGLYGFFWRNKALPANGEEIDLQDYALVAKTLDTLDSAAKAIEAAGETGLIEALQWIASSRNSAQLIKALPKLDSIDLARINAVSGIELLKKSLDTWSLNKSNSDEGFWHQALVQFSFVFSQVFSTPITMFKSKAYVGGKNIDDEGGKYPDFLLKNDLTKHVLLVEIKKPQTDLLHSKPYRSPDIYAISHEVAGAVSQIAKYKSEFLFNYSEMLRKAGDNRFLLADPRCLIVIGDTAQLDDDNKRDSFEHFRRGQRGVEIITFDELFKKIEFLVKLLEGSEEFLQATQ